MTEGIKSISVLVRMWDDDEKVYRLPVDGPQLIADLIEWIPDMAESRAAELITGAPIGYVGPFLEIRRVSDSYRVRHHHTCPCTACRPGA